MWRIVASDRIPDGLADVRQRWAYADLLEAHQFLDAWEALQPPPPTPKGRK